MRVAVFGAGGRMGSTVCRAVADDPELELVAAVDPHHSGLDVHQVAGADVPGLQVMASPDALTAASAEVAVDFTEASGAGGNLVWCADHGVHAVVGTTGLTDEQLGTLADRFAAGGANCFVAPNFAIGAVLMMRFAAMAAPYFESAEVIELHHDNKVDAPSGTALLTAARMDEAKRASGHPWGQDPTRTELLPGARGGSEAGGVHIHSLRLRGLVAHQEVVLGTTGQTLTIRHDTTDRTSFMPGVLLAIKAVAGRPGLTVGLDALL